MYTIALKDGVVAKIGLDCYIKELPSKQKLCSNASNLTFESNDWVLVIKKL